VGWRQSATGTYYGRDPLNNLVSNSTLFWNAVNMVRFSPGGVGRQYLLPGSSAHMSDTPELLLCAPCTAPESSDTDVAAYTLVTSTELPPWYTRAPYVDTGYRRCATLHSCTCSIFKLHNESVNIWLHLPVSFLLVPYLLLVLRVMGLLHNGFSTDLGVVFVSVLVGNVSTLLLSGICHTYYCLSQRAHNICWFIDFVGLHTGILGGGIGIAHFSFKCHDSLYVAYFTTMAVLYPTLIWFTWRKFWAHVGTLPLNPIDGFPEFILPLATLNLFSWVSVLIVAKVSLPEYTSLPEFEKAWNLSVSCPVLLVFGSLIQYFNIPERFVRRGATDIWGHSHQLWHVCGMVLMFVWIHAITTHYEACQRYECSVRRVI
jgi:adiponectin receptor